MLSALLVCDATASHPRVLKTIFCGPLSAWPKGKTLELPLRLRANSSTADSAGSSEIFTANDQSLFLPSSTADSAGSSEIFTANDQSLFLPSSTADSEMDYSYPPSQAANIEIGDKVPSQPSTSSLRAVRRCANREPVPGTVAVPAPALHCPAPRRPLRDHEIEKFLFYGSDQSDNSTDSDGDDEERQQTLIMQRRGVTASLCACRNASHTNIDYNCI